MTAGREKDCPNDASTTLSTSASARSEKNKKISKSSPPVGGKASPFYDFLVFFSFTANAGPPFGRANTLFFFEKIQPFGKGRDKLIIQERK